MNAALMPGLHAADVMTTPLLKWLGRVDYEPTWRAMQRFTEQRDVSTRDEVWLLEHDPVFTLGMNADRSHVLSPGNIPVIQIDRGGQVTYHGPGQLILYPLIDIRRAGLGVRDLVTVLERTVISYLAASGVAAECKPKAPGVYVRDRKIASIGLRIRRNGSYHGLAFNVRMDLQPFQRVNPCGYAGLEMTQLSEFRGDADVARVAPELGSVFLDTLMQLRTSCAQTRAVK